eukprot:6713072-Pyramimonas_sp.AAC.1
MTEGDYRKVQGAMQGVDIAAVADGHAASSSAPAPTSQSKAGEKKRKREERLQQELEDAKENPEKAARKKSKKEFEEAIGKSKAFLRACGGELADIPSLCRKLAAKNFPEAMGAFLTTRAADFKKTIDEFGENEYSDAKATVRDDDKTKQELDQTAQTLLARLNAIQERRARRRRMRMRRRRRRRGGEKA